MALTIGIDPGKSGAVAAITEAGAVVRLDDTPLVAGGYDVAAMAGMLSVYRPEDVALVVLEFLGYFLVDGADLPKAEHGH